MKVKNKDMTLYAVTDRSWIGEGRLIEQVKEALDGGITFLQLREKTLSQEEFLEEAKEMKELAKRYEVPFVINDNIYVAVESGADGVHVGQDDMSLQKARAVLGKDKIIGVSTHNVTEATKAQEDGADYIGVGAIHGSTTKDDANAISMEEVKKICDTVSIPVVAIGGIKKDNLDVLKGTGVDGVAVVSAIFASKDITSSCKELKALVKEMKQ